MTFLGDWSGMKAFLAMHSPSTIMKNLSPTSPCLMMRVSSFSKVSTFNASAMVIISYWSILLKRGTFFRKSVYVVRFFAAASFTILLKVSLSSSHSVVFSLLSTLAARGQLYSRASSPKTSPAVQVFTTFSAPSIFLRQSTLPSSMRNMHSPSSPCWMMRTPESTCFSLKASTIVAISCLSRAWNKKFGSKHFSMRAFCSGVFSYFGATNSVFLFHMP
mmetsp:Transcript_125528/g.390776  ORF Transcript_125528/g.390776 Transcript_125528/m.390776 type:complete len:218 (+) Transcript_125528:222-875(+)